MGTEMNTPKKDGQPLIGKVVWWSLTAASYDAVNAALQDTGIAQSDTDLVYPPACNVALRRARATIQRRLDTEAEGKGATERVLLRPITVSKKETVYGVVREQVKQNGTPENAKFDHTYRAYIRADVGGITEEGSDPVKSVLLEEYNREMSTCPTHKLSAILVGLARKGDAIALRESGGVYFFPNAVNESLKKVDALLAALSCHLYTITVRNDGDSMDAVSAAAEANFMQEVDLIKERVQAMKGVKKKSLEGVKVNEIADFRNRVALYRSLLGAGLADVDASLAELEQTIEAKISAPVKKATGGDTAPTAPQKTETPAATPADAGQAPEAPAPDAPADVAETTPDETPSDPAPTTSADPMDALTMEQRATLKKWQAKIETAIDQAGPYSHNIAGLALSAIAKECGVEVANQQIDRYDLTALYGIRPVERA